MKNIIVKNSWDDITIKEYQQIMGLLNDPELIDDQVELNNYLLNVLTGLSLNEIRNLTLSDYTSLISYLKFLSSEPKGVVKKSYTINNNEYKTVLKLSNVTTGQYMDLQTLTTNWESTLENLGKVIAVFLIPKGMKYGEYNIEDVGNEIENHMKISDALSLAFFFSTLNQKWLKASAVYLSKMKKKADKEMSRMKNNKLRKHLNQNGVS